MSLRARCILVVMWLMSLFAVGTLARGQAYQFNPLPEPIVVSGNDVAYRVEGWLGNAPAGRLVIRMDGRWVEPQTAPMRTPRPIR